MTNQIIHLCPDCGQLLHEEYYERPNNRSYSTFTCNTKTCELYTVTLRWDEWQAKQANGSLEAYRVMNRNAWKPLVQS